MNPVKPLLNDKLSRPDWINVPERDPDFLWLDKNENLDSVFVELINKEVIAKQVGNIDLSTYPELGSLYKDLSAMDNVDPRQVLLTTGSDGAIRTVFQTFVEPGAKVFVTNPSFAMYDVYCKVYGAETFYVNYERVGERIYIDVAKLIALISHERPRLVCLPNPDSPTGTVLPESDIMDIHAACVAVDAMLFIDEAYYPFYEKTMAAHIGKEGISNLIVCRTFSKAWGLAGVRVGHLISDKDTISFMNKTRPMYEIGALAMKIAHTALPYYNQMMESVAVITEGKDFFEHEMRELGFMTLGTFGNFSHVAFGKHKEILFEQLDRFVYYRKDFAHPSLQGFTRFSAAPIEIMKKVVDSIRITITSSI